MGARKTGVCGGKPEGEVVAEKQTDAAKMKAFFSKEEQAPGA